MAAEKRIRTIIDIYSLSVGLLSTGWYASTTGAMADSPSLPSINSLVEWCEKNWTPETNDEKATRLKSEIAERCQALAELGVDA